MTRTYRIIDADGHVLEPKHIWAEYIDPKYADRAPSFFLDENGHEQLRIGDREYRLAKGFSIAGSSQARTTGETASSYEEGRAGGFDPHARLSDMDIDEIDAAFLYPTLGLAFGAIEEPGLAAAICRAYNRWLADYCSADPERLFGVALLPMQSPALAAEELAFARKELGFRGAMLHPSPTPDGRLPHARDNDVVWAAAQEHDVAISLHGGFRKLLPPFLDFQGFPGRAAQHLLHHTMGMMLGCTSIVWYGICERFPKVRFAFLEAGGGWIAGWLDRMDRHFEDVGMNDSELKLKPSEYFQRQCWISFEPVERSLSALTDFLGPDKILWATDYPHADGFFPGAPRMIMDLPGLSDESKARLLVDGARSYYALG